MASYVSDCTNTYVAPNGDSGMNNNYTTYSSPEEASSNCLTNSGYYVNSFSSYGPGGPCLGASSDVDGSGYVSDGVNYWFEGTASYAQEGATNTTPGNPDWGSAAQDCQLGESWPITLTGTAPPIYQIYQASTEGFKLFEKSSTNIVLIIFILIVISALVYYFAVRK